MKIIFRKKDERVIAGIRIQGIELEVIPVRHGTFKKKNILFISNKIIYACMQYI